MPFGKYRGWGIAEIPDDYLRWLLSLEDLREPLLSAVRQEHTRRFGQGELAFPEGTGTLNMAGRIIDVGYRELAKRFHPDRPGGDHSRMVELNEAATLLRGGLHRFLGEGGG